jgi:translation elongation factor EF-Ts
VTKRKQPEVVNITADMVKAVRKATGAGTLDCKELLLAAKGDVKKAIAMVYMEGKTGPKRVWV